MAFPFPLCSSRNGANFRSNMEPLADARFLYAPKSGIRAAGFRLGRAPDSTNEWIDGEGPAEPLVGVYK